MNQQNVALQAVTTTLFHVTGSVWKSVGVAMQCTLNRAKAMCAYACVYIKASVPKTPMVPE